jgi:DNA-binding HxlR family transcriptional regulator
MPRATYAELGDACATAHAMELIGARWSYPILRELMLGPKRFAALLASVRGITPAVLSARLREMTSAGLIEPTTLPAPANAAVYDLTPWARELAPILRELGRWALSSPLRVADGGLTPDAVIQAMITMAGDVPPTCPLRIQLLLVDTRVDADTEHPYRVQWTDSGFAAERGEFTDTPSIASCDSSAWGRVLFAGLPLEESGARLTGDPAVVRTLVEGFQRGATAAEWA